MQLGIIALRDVTRALRGDGAGRKGGAEQERGALFDLAGICDRLASFADDQSEDDWQDFWVTSTEVESLRVHVTALGALRGISPSSAPALRGLLEELELLAQRMH